MKAGSICAHGVDTARTHESAWRAAERMHQRGVGSLVVVNESEEPIGILTDRDLVERVMAKGMDPYETVVGDVMTHEPKTVNEDAPIETVLGMMQRGSFRRLPVVNTDGKVCGMISLDDILMQWSNQFCLLGQLLHEETPRGVAEEIGFGLG
jgi:CBS domain-containing protein